MVPVTLAGSMREAGRDRVGSTRLEAEVGGSMRALAVSAVAQDTEEEEEEDMTPRTSAVRDMEAHLRLDMAEGTEANLATNVEAPASVDQDTAGILLPLPLKVSSAAPLLASLADLRRVAFTTLTTIPTAAMINYALSC